jgi:hypothetical protein
MPQATDKPRPAGMVKWSGLSRHSYYPGVTIGNWPDNAGLTYRRIDIELQPQLQQGHVPELAAL